MKWYNHIRSGLLLVGTLVLLGVIGLGLMHTVELHTPLTTVTVIPNLSGEYTRVAWMGNWLIAQQVPMKTKTTPGFESWLWKVHPDGSNAEMLSLPDYPGCARQSFEAPAHLPDGRLGYIVRCLPPQASIWQLYMMAIDLQTGQATPLRNAPLPSVGVGTGGYSWNPTMTRGITSDGDRLIEQLYWFTADTSQPLQPGFGQAHSPTWSPGGSSIAFVAAPEQGLSGPLRLEALFTLYEMHADGTGIHPLVQTFRHPQGIAWSPDSHWLVFPGDFEVFFRHEQGLWLVDAATGTRRLLAQGEFTAPAWSQDGRRIAAIQVTGQDLNFRQDIMVLEVGSMVGEKTNRRLEQRKPAFQMATP